MIFIIFIPWVLFIPRDLQVRYGMPQCRYGVGKPDPQVTHSKSYFCTCFLLGAATVIVVGAIALVAAIMIGGVSGWVRLELLVIGLVGRFHDQNPIQSHRWSILGFNTMC